MVYVLSESYGKDSMAMLIELKRRNLPVDYVIHCNIMFNDKVSGEHPLMAEWIPYAEKKIEELYGIKVINVTAKYNFTQQFYKVKQRGKHIGDNYGFPYPTKFAWCNGYLKLQPIEKYIKKLIKKYGAVTEYVGIAKDEPERLDRYKEIETENHKYITLADLDIDETQAMEICKEHNLLSPKYTNSFRGGCWFCPKQSMSDLYDLWKNYNDYFKTLEQMEKDSFNSFRPNQTLKQIRERFENGYVPKKKKRHKQYSIFDLIGE